MGGTGKSSMAAMTASQLRDRFTDGVLWANTRVSDPFDVLNSWATAYNYDFGGLSDVQSRASAMRNLLVDKRVLIVLDDVTHPTQVRPLWPGHNDCAVLVTTRSEDVAIALGCTVMRVSELSLGSCLALLVKLLGEERLDRERTDAELICSLLHYLPLGVEIVGQLLAARPRRQLADMVTRLQNAKDRLDLGIADRDLRTSFMVSWDALDRTHQETFAHMAIFEGRSFSADTLASVMGMQELTVVDQLETLAALSLVSLDEGNRYQQHPLLADFAREQLGGRPGVWLQFAKYELAFVTAVADDYKCLESEWENVMAGLRVAADLECWGVVLDYADVLAVPWLHTSQHRRARSAYPMVCKAAESINDQHALAVNLSRWAGICIEQGDFDEAQKMLEISLSLADLMEAPTIISVASYNLARVFLERGRYGEATTYLNICLDICEQLDNSDERILARHLLAQIAYRQGDFDSAEVICLEALAVHDAHPVPLGAVRVLRLLMDIAIERQQPELALSVAEQATSIAQTAQLQDDLAEIRYGTAVAYRIAGRYALALHLARKVAEVSELTGKISFNILALHEQSVVMKLQAQYDEALVAAQQCLALFVEGEESFNHVICLLNMGEIQESLGSIQEAQATYRRALEMAEEIGHPRTQILKERLTTLE